MVNNLTINILEPFLTKPKEKLHLAQISREMNIPHPTARLWLNKLERQGIIRKEIKGRLTLHSLNLENPDTISHIIIAEKSKLIRKGEESIILRELISDLQQELEENTNALIFGSAAEKPGEAEDIDLLIIGKIDEGEIKKLSDKNNKKIHMINVKSTKNITRTLKEEIIKKHIIIKGSEEIVRWMIWQQ